MNRKKTIILWENDIVWIEEFITHIEKLNIVCEEVDSKEELLEKINPDKRTVCIISESVLKENALKLEKILQEIDDLCSTTVVCLLETDNTPIEILAFQWGASEVLVKSKGIEIAIVRILNLLKIQSANDISFESNNLLFRTGEEFFEHNFCDIHFTVKEKQVLFELLKNQGKLVTREEMLHRYWSEKKKEDTRVVDTVIKQIRKKLKNTTYQILSIYGRGYLLRG